VKEEKIFWVEMLNSMKEDKSELPKIGFAELMAKYFYIPRNIKPNILNGLLKNSF